MKISEMTNDQAAESMIRIAEHFGNICDDAEALKLIDEFNEMEKKPLIETIGKLLPRLMSCLLKTHRNDLYGIVGALTLQPAEAVAQMNFAETIKVVKDSYDEVLASFFPSSVKRAKAAE